MRMCSASSPMACRGRRVGRRVSRCRRSRRSSRPVHGWGRSRWRVCLGGSPSRSGHRGWPRCGWRAGGWWRSTGAAWTSQTRRSTQSSSAGQGCEKSAFPQARLVALAECGTHAMFDAVVGGYNTSEVALADELIGRLEPGMLLLADRGFYSFGLWAKAVGTGADLLWRVKTGLRPKYLRTLDDHSWLAAICPTVGDK